MRVVFSNFFDKFAQKFAFFKIPFFSQNRLNQNFAKKTKIFAFFASERNAKKCENVLSRKLQNFRETIFLFRWKH